MAATESAIATAAPTEADTSSEMTIQQMEVAHIRASYPNRCRVISDLGEHTNVVTVQPENMDVTIKFQLKAAYPEVVPGIIIRSESLEKNKLIDLQQSLQNTARELTGKPMIKTLVKDVERELLTLGLRPGKTINVNAHTFIDQPLKKEKTTKKQKRQSKSEEEDLSDQKLPSMKTADDVIKRIIWDGSLEKDDFLVGYLDRFKGLVEKYFSAFSWEDLATVDYDVLAIPRHRIEYFKYKDVKVWDKTKRLDNVFGSANGTKTIDTVIREIEARERLQQAEETIGATPLKNNVDYSEKFECESSADDDDDDEDDDGIVVTIGSCGTIGTSPHSTTVGSKSGTEGANAKSTGGDVDPYWEDKLRPNYFLCVRITDDNTINGIGKVQDHLMEQEPLLSECCISGSSLHVTLCTLGLDTPDQLTHCIETLKKIKPDLIAARPKSALQFQGVSNFYSRVVYAKVQYGDNFMEFCNLLKLLLRQAGVEIRDGYEFIPHATIIKTSRPVSTARGSKKINPNLYQQFTSTNFGKQQIDSVHLCSMENSRREDGFYLSPLELHLDREEEV